MLEVAGFRYYMSGRSLDAYLGHEVSFSAEIDNPHDVNAVQICLDNQKIGNVNRLQARTFRSWLKDRRVTGVLERLNGKPDWPRAFVFVRVRPAMRAVA